MRKRIAKMLFRAASKMSKEKLTEVIRNTKHIHSSISKSSLVSRKIKNYEDNRLPR